MRFWIAIVISAFACPALAQSQLPTDDPYHFVTARLESLIVMPVADWRTHADVAHPEDVALDDSGWEAFSAGSQWSNGSRVFRRRIELPESANGYPLSGATVKLDVRFDFDWNNKGPVTIATFSNGGMISRGDDDMQQPVPLTTNARPGQTFNIAIRIDSPDIVVHMHHARLCIEPPAGHVDPALLRTEIIAAQPMIAAYDRGRAEREALLDSAVKAIDFAALDAKNFAAFDSSLHTAQTKLQALNPYLKQFTIRAVGNSHIDMAWLWPWTETVEVVRNTFQSVLDLMNEYPDLKFTMSSARTYEWMQEKYPYLFDQIRQRVKEGRWEVIGGMWVEPDLNMPDGESLVRQILVGKNYFRKNFGADIHIGWNPDSFGYNWQLPQIYKKAGIDYFVTSKLLWATDYTKFPYRLFYWQAPDGSKLLTYFPHEYANDFNAEQAAKDLAAYAPMIYGKDLEKNPSPDMLYLFGIGDHGGGPTRTMLDTADKLRAPDTVFPKIEFTTAKQFFAEIQDELPKLDVPTWNDELYFEYHRGVFTTQSDTKQRIRHDEEAMLDAEKFSSLASLFGRAYDHEALQADWKNLLFDHFHDVMPGSGLAVNYLEAKRNLEDVDRSAQLITEAAQHEIASHIKTAGLGVPVVVFNSLSWPRHQVTEIAVQMPSAAPSVAVFDSKGRSVLSQLLSVDKVTHRVRLLILADVPSLGYATYFVRARGKAPVSETKQNAVGATDLTMDNGLVHLEIDGKSGCVVALNNPADKQAAFAPAETDTGGPRTYACGALLQAFYDKPKRWDAWNIDADFEKQHWDIDTADSVSLIEGGPLRSIIRVKKHFQNSTFIQDFTMYAASARVDIRMQVEWHEKHILLKATFPVSVHSDKATFEIPYGSIERATTRNTPAEQAKFEVPALRWADLSDNKHGFSLLNDSKYGYDVRGNVLRISLLRSPEWPDPQADEGHHEFTISMFPHSGTWKDAMTVRKGYELNYPLHAAFSQAHDGSLPPEQSLISVDGDNVVVTAVKHEEDGDGMIVRMYEWAGKSATVKVHLAPGNVTSASETNLMESPSGDLTLDHGSIAVPIKPFEIKTIRIAAPR